jgi:hypothetical protein
MKDEGRQKARSKTAMMKKSGKVREGEEGKGQERT